MEANVSGGLWCAFLGPHLNVSYLHSKVTEVLTPNVTLPNIRSTWVGRRYVSLNIYLCYRLIAL
jgi:hypothetical protein